MIMILKAVNIDLKYPDQLQELHNGYPLAPENLAVSSDMLSEYWQNNC